MGLLSVERGYRSFVECFGIFESEIVTNLRVTMLLTGINRSTNQHHAPKLTPSSRHPSPQVLDQILEPWFIFAVIWSIGATCYGEGRVKFNTFLRNKMKEVGVALPLPEEGLVYDYQIQDGGLFSTRDRKGGDEEDEEKQKGKVKVCGIVFT